MNQYLILGAVGAFLMSFLAGGILGWHEKAIRVPAMLEAQQTTDKQACAAAQALTKETNDALQKSRRAISAKLAAYKLQHPSTCVSVTSTTNVPNSGAEHAGSNGTGLNSDWLRYFAATAEQYRAQIAMCVDFLAKERELGKN